MAKKNKEKRGIDLSLFQGPKVKMIEICPTTSYSWTLIGSGD